jgi:hypothetical protein
MGGDARLRSRRIAAGRCADCGRDPKPGRRRCQECLDRSAAKNAARRRRLKAAAFAAYGDQCACCGEANPKFLTIDHVNGGGHAHRRQIGGPGLVLEWLARHGYPEGFQLLCWNCNCARAYNGGVCPHEEERGEVRRLRAV